MGLLNYTTKIPTTRTIGEIQATLAKHGARAIMIGYGDEGEAQGLAFKIETADGELAFELPIKPEAVAKVLAGQKIKGQLKHAGAGIDLEQSRRVAWRITKDWVEAQMAYLETEMVTMEEIFLPYMLSPGGKTLYKAMKDRHFYLKEASK